ncbi:MAG: general secretion pathway protein GspH [Methylocystis sp.]|nr:MAG: general secretion pathway protein GspH [Methylocystis sp.]
MRLSRSLRRRAGVTLLEALVALALVALMAGMASQLLRPPSPRLRLESATRAFCATLRATRARAIATNAEALVVVDLYRKTYASPVGAEGRLPTEAQIALDVASMQRGSETTGSIAFFPDGSSTGGDMQMTTPEARATIGVNWLTGEASCVLR